MHIGHSERATQNRVIALFRDELSYRFLGDWSDRANSNLDEDLLNAWLDRRGYGKAYICYSMVA
jgi:type I restriction enzyme R subunit